MGFLGFKGIGGPLEDTQETPVKQNGKEPKDPFEITKINNTTSIFQFGCCWKTLRDGVFL